MGLDKLKNLCYTIRVGRRLEPAEIGKTEDVTTTYKIGYQLSDYRPVGTAHRSLRAAVGSLDRAIRIARKSGDIQAIKIQSSDGALTDYELADIEAYRAGAVRTQHSAHGAGRYSVQGFDASGKLVYDRDI